MNQLLDWILGFQTCFADGGDRTHTLLRELDFESSASASSATSAMNRDEVLNRSNRNASNSANLLFAICHFIRASGENEGLVTIGDGRA